MSPKRQDNLRRLMAPRHVAVIGGEAAATAARQCRAFGFAGPIWGVNPRRTELGGAPCFRTLADLPQPPDAVFLAVPREATVELVAALRDLGAGGAVCFADGFAETGPEGRARERALAEAAGDLALVGPNCFGLIDARSGLALWPYGHGCRRLERGIAVISQSGMLASNLAMARRALPIACLVSCGNQAVLGIEDFLAPLIADPAITGIALYIEALRDPAAFGRLALEALARGKPLVALKGGLSPLGARLTAGHTGAAAVPGEESEAATESLFARLGILRVATPAQLIESLKMLTLGGVPGGRRLAVFTGSGGDAALAANLGAKAGLVFPQPDPGATGPETTGPETTGPETTGPETTGSQAKGAEATGAEGMAALRRLLPEAAAHLNPLDLTHRLWGRPEVAEAVAALLGSTDESPHAPGYDAALLVQDYPRPELGIGSEEDRADARAFAGAARAAGLPAAVCSSLPENLDGETRDFLAALGVAPLQGLPEALQAIADAARYGARRRELLARSAPLAAK